MSDAPHSYTDEEGHAWTLAELLADLDKGDYLYLTPKMCADLARHIRQCVPNERLIIALEGCASKLAALGAEFNATNFTDRHGDGPICVGLAKHARAVLDEVRSFTPGRIHE